MVVAIAMVHAPHGFFMNWTGKQAGEGFEYHILAIAMCLAAIDRRRRSGFDRPGIAGRTGHVQSTNSNTEPASRQRQV